MKIALPDIKPNVLMVWRFSIAAVVLLPFVRRDARLWRAGVELGLWLWAGYWTQIIGLQYTTVNRSAFITSLSVIFVPMIAAIRGRRISWLVWLAAVMAVVGVGLLSYDLSPPNIGDAWTLACAIIYAMFIYRLEWASRQFAALPLMSASMIVVAILSGACVAIEHPALSTSMPWKAVIYLGLVATAITTTLQVIGQRWLPAPEVGVIYTLEPVFAAVFGYVFLREMPGARGIMGAVLIVVAAIVVSTGSQPESE
jgi:drug/metabolite transporter (DMT)-like permease